MENSTFDYSEVDWKIIDTARTCFRKKGIMNTEMKDLANEVGISRSTLYRHFASKEEILFFLVQTILRKIMDSTRLPRDIEFLNGYDALEWQSHSLVASMLKHSEDIIMVRDFDVFFTHEYPKVEAADEYESFIRSAAGRREMMKSLMRGIEDGSICRIENPDLVLVTMINGCFGMAQRILPREKHVLEENGYGRELLRCQMDLMLSAIKVKKPEME